MVKAFWEINYVCILLAPVNNENSVIKKDEEDDWKNNNTQQCSWEKM